MIKQTSKQALAELREILGVLRQDRDEQPRAPTAGLDQLHTLLDSARGSGLDVHLYIDGNRRPLPTAVELAAYRILQESLTNVARHAGRCRTELQIAYDNSTLRLSVSDDGSCEHPFPEGTGHGIAGMRQRAQALGGTLHAGPRPDGGFEVRASLPLLPTVRS